MKMLNTVVVSLQMLKRLWLVGGLVDALIESSSRPTAVIKVEIGAELFCRK